MSLHCVTIYPTPLNQLNLSRLEYLRNFTKNVGFSDHSLVSLDKHQKESVLTQFENMIKMMKDNFTVFQCSRVIPADLGDKDLKISEALKSCLSSLCQKRVKCNR